MKLRPTAYFETFFEKEKRVHLFFCSALLVLMVFILSVSRKWSYAPGSVAVYICILGCLYTGRWFCRKWLLNGKWAGLLLLLVISLIGYDIVGLTIFVYLFRQDVPLNHLIESSITIMSCSFIVMFCGFFIAVIRSAIREKMNGLTLAEQKKESELNLLRSQVSPHFLFNTLNNMYSLSINRPDQMPPLLLRLSELLRYSVYDADQELVPLADELEYIRNYIELENIRSSDRLLLRVNLQEAPKQLKVAPMLLIVFVENAFKHARNTFEQEIEISMNCKTENGNIYFEIENSYSDQSAENLSKNPSSGFGIANVTKRLQLLYPGEYELKQSCTSNKFKVELCLKTK
jgi:sensor histidine kinase YesM